MRNLLNRIKEYILDWWEDYCWHSWERTGKRIGCSTRRCRKCGEEEIFIAGIWRWDEDKYK